MSKHIVMHVKICSYVPRNFEFIGEFLFYLSSGQCEQFCATTTAKQRTCQRYNGGKNAARLSPGSPHNSDNEHARWLVNYCGWRNPRVPGCIVTGAFLQAALQRDPKTALLNTVRTDLSPHTPHKDWNWSVHTSTWIASRLSTVVNVHISYTNSRGLRYTTSSSDDIFVNLGSIGPICTMTNHVK